MLWEDLREGRAPHEAATSLEADFLDLYAPIAGSPARPFIIGQLGQSLDGYIATKSGASHYVTGPESLVHLHRLRALVDAVIVGWRTVAADDPQLTVRHVAGKNPLRVVVDLEGRLPATHKIFTGPQPGAIRITGPRTADLPGVKSLRLTLDEPRASPHAIVDALVKEGCVKILIEGGGALVTSFVTAGALDRLHLGIAPLLIGDGRRGLSLAGVETLADAPRPPSRAHPMGNDVLFDLDLSGMR